MLSRIICIVLRRNRPGLFELNGFFRDFHALKYCVWRCNCRCSRLNIAKQLNWMVLQLVRTWLISPFRRADQSQWVVQPVETGNKAYRNRLKEHIIHKTSLAESVLWAFGNQLLEPISYNYSSLWQLISSTCQLNIHFMWILIDWSILCSYVNWTIKRLLLSTIIECQ